MTSGLWDRVDTAAAGVGGAGLAVAAAILAFGPAAPIPVHFNLAGDADRWSGRGEAALVLAGLVGGLALCYALLKAMEGMLASDAPGRRGLRMGRLAVVWSAGCVVALLATGVWGVPIFGERHLVRPVILSLLILGLGALCGKVSPNPVVGVRTYWSLRSRLAWDKSNRLAGRLFFAIGAFGLLLGPWVSPARFNLGLFSLVIAAALVSVFESWRVWRDDPERMDR